MCVKVKFQGYEEMGENGVTERGMRMSRTNYFLFFRKK